MIAELAIMFCLTTVIHHEARGEPLKGKIAVAHVALNRSKIKNKDVCAIVWEPKQFSNIRLPSKKTMNTYAWEDSYIVAQLVIDGKTVDPTKGATHFHAHYVNPYWAKNLFYTTTIGGHKFYK